MLEDTSLYVHIPFCISKCDYCDFFSKACGSEGIPDSYIEALCAEIEFYAKKYSVNSWKTLYIGGGTPSLLSPSQMDFLFDRIFSLSESKISESTFEMNPESLSEEKLAVLKKYGFNRLSLGIQSFSKKSLASVKRHCPPEKIFEAMKMLSSSWSGLLNLDLISGLPYLTDEDFLSGLEKLISFNPSHISLYTLTVEEETPLFKNIKKGLPFDFDTADRQWLLGFGLLEKSGFEQYEVSNFCRKKNISLHNMTYWQQQNYIGAGSGAAGTIWLNDEQTSFCSENDICGTRWTVSKNIDEYIKFWTCAESKNFSEIGENELPCETEKITLKTREFEYLMMGFRTKIGVDKGRYKVLFKNLPPFFGNLEARLCKSSVWKKFVLDSCAFINKERAFLSSFGLKFLNELLLDLV